MPADLSIVIPVHNRGELIRYTLESVRRAREGLSIEVIVVDDGSDPPAEEGIALLGFQPEKIVRQQNRGLLMARLAGLDAATGRYLLFLDSDDLVSEQKFRLHIAAMEAANADVSYSDCGYCELKENYETLTTRPGAPYRDTSDSVDLYIDLQPAPHSPVFRTDYLRRIVGSALFPPSPAFNAVAEIWFYHNAAVVPARIVKVPGPHAIVGLHSDARLTNHWEKLGVASLGVMEAFSRACPKVAETARARQQVAEKAFGSWRKLPRGFSAEFCRRERAVWKTLNQAPRPERVGGRGFQWLARFLGMAGAAQLLRLFQNASYRNCRTITDGELQKLLDALPTS